MRRREVSKEERERDGIKVRKEVKEGVVSLGEMKGKKERKKREIKR